MSFRVLYQSGTLMTCNNIITVGYVEDGEEKSRDFKPDLYPGSDASREHAAQLWIADKYREHAERGTYDKLLVGVETDDD